MSSERQVTFTPVPKVLTNVNVFSQSGQWIVYDTRSARGEVFDGTTVEMVNVETNNFVTLWRAEGGSHVGVATFAPAGRERVVFIQGPVPGDDDFTYGPARRQGVVVDLDTRSATNLDARDLAPPFTPGALRGGTHLHVFSPDGTRVSSTYEDHVLERLGPVTLAPTGHDANQRNVAVSVLGEMPRISHAHPRNHDGHSFTAVVTRTVNHPTPGSDEIARAFEEAWIGMAGYAKPDGTRQRYALAFQGNVVTPDGRTISEVFVVDLPDDLTRPGDTPLEGTETTRPAPPAGCRQRRITFTADDQHPGIQGPRHWLRSSPDGSLIAFLNRDDAGVVRLNLVSPNGGLVRTLATETPLDVTSAFTWSPDGRWIAHTADGSVCVTDAQTGACHRLTPPDRFAGPAPQACVFSPDGRRIAFVRPVADAGTGKSIDQIGIVDFVPPR